MSYFVKKKRTLLFDMDGVLVDSSSVSLKKLNAKFSSSYSIHDKTHYRWTWDFVKSMLGLHVTNEEIIDFAYGEDVLSQAKPLPGAQALVKSLSEEGFSVMISTSRPARHRKVTLETIEEYFPSINQVYMREKHHSNSFESKLWSISNSMPLNLIDDDGNLLLSLKPWILPSVALGIRDWPWNKNVQDHLGNPISVERFDSPSLRRIGNFENIEVSPSPWVRDYRRWLNDLLKIKN